MAGELLKVCRCDEIDEGKTKSFMINARSICMAKEEGKIYAFDNICTHDGGLLGEGVIYDRQIECPRHGARFDIATGQATQMPAVVGIQTYEVQIEDGEILVNIPE